ncbi:MAG: TonB-dependent receptor, partial [Saprospiraceae bacterium]
GITFASNISEQVDFTISSRTGLNSVENTLQRAGNTNYLSQTTTAKLGWVLPGGLVYRTSLAHQFYDGLADNFDSDYFLWNMSLGKKMLKEDRGELAITICYFFFQNQSIVRNVTDVYIEDLRTNVLQQYFMLKFTWNFRNFNSGKAKADTESEDDQRRKWRGRF